MSSVARVMAAGAVGGFISIFTSWLFMGALFHSYQRLTPATWRPEGPRQYTLSSVVQILAGAAVGFLFHATGAALHASDGWVAAGLMFGTLLWIGVAAPGQLINGIYVNVDRRVIVGGLLDSLVQLLIVGCCCAWAVA